MGNNIIFSTSNLRDRLINTHLKYGSIFSMINAEWNCKDINAIVFLRVLNAAEYHWENVVYEYLQGNLDNMTLEDLMDNVGEFILTVKEYLDEINVNSTKTYNNIWRNDSGYQKINPHGINSYSEWLHVVVLPTLPELLSHYNEFNSWCLITSAINGSLFPDCKTKYTKQMISDALDIVNDYGFELQAETMPFVNSVYYKLSFTDSIRYGDLKPYIIQELNEDNKAKGTKSYASGIYYLDNYLKGRYIPNNLASIQQLQYNMLQLYEIKKNRRDDQLRVNFEKIVAGSRIECSDPSAIIDVDPDSIEIKPSATIIIKDPNIEE